MTYDEAINNGYKNGEQRFFMGYVSRKANIANQEVKIAAGSRKGEMYVELPYWNSTKYSIRQYLVKA